MTTTSRVAVLPNHIKLGLRPGQIALDLLIWPLGVPDDIAGKHLQDLTANDHLIVLPSDTLHFRLGFGTRAKVSVMVLEPRAIHGTHLKLLKLTHRRFHRVLTCDEALLARIPNGVFFPFGGTWIPDWRVLDPVKTRMCSLIASSKRSQEGHQLRHDIVDWARSNDVDLDALGGAYDPFEAKEDGLEPYRFSVVIENVRERNYFTEKLIDALLCKTVPIYWGCPNIGDFLDTSAMIVCDSAEDIRSAVKAISAKEYSARVPLIEALQDRAGYYGDLYVRSAQAVLAQG